MPDQVILNVDDTEAVRYAKSHTLRIAGFRTTPVLQAYTSDGKLLGTVALH